MLGLLYIEKVFQILHGDLIVRSKQLILITGDLIALLLFVFIGQLQHGLVDPDNPILRVLSTGWIYALLWLGSGWILGAFPTDENGFTRQNLIDRSLNAWLITVLLGSVIRAFLLNSTVIFRSFLLASIGFGLLFLWVWRIPFWLWQRKKAHAIEAQLKVG